VQKKFWFSFFYHFIGEKNFGQQNCIALIDFFLKNVLITAILKIVSIKVTEFSSQFCRKIGAIEEKSLAP